MLEKQWLIRATELKLTEVPEEAFHKVGRREWGRVQARRDLQKVAVV